ncbi:MAG: hypothetical protein IJL21_04325 [Alphaproteobacteria bacterium]|nr:hypothetical protein [Alphaproteobacteria bacterium]
MKPLYVLSILLGLCACSDKPVFVQKGFFCNGTTNDKQTTDIKLYKDYAIITIGNKDIKLEKKRVDETFIRYSDFEYKLEFYKLSSDDVMSAKGQDWVQIGFILNGRKCFWAEVEADNPYQHLQSKEIDRKTQRKIQKLFEKPELNFHETDIECLNVTCVEEECSNVWDKYKSLDVDSEKAILKTDDKTIVFKLYTQDATEETMAVYDDDGIYKNENDEQPMFLHFVDNDTYSLGTDLNHWSQCRKARK